MPELPEAETIVRGLRPVVTGARIRRTRVQHEDVLESSAAGLARALKGLAIQDVSRRGKNVVLVMEGPAYLVVNLGMTGGLYPLAAGGRNPAVTHPAVRFYFEEGGQLVYNDARRFGRLRLLNGPDWEAWSRRLGPEPLSPAFTPDDLAAGLGASRTPVRNWLLDQRRVAGVGNIYASEALHRAGIDPRRPASSIGPEATRRLYRSVVAVLSEAIRARGTTIRDYRDATGDEGGFGPRLRAYGRDGEPCLTCGTPIRRVVFGNRSAFLCPTCQPHEESTGGSGA
jgi:formamidopyrimidine-DNA glycosylase